MATHWVAASRLASMRTPHRRPVDFGGASAEGFFFICVGSFAARVVEVLALVFQLVFAKPIADV